MADDDLELPLNIPVKSLVQEFDCPICFNPITDCAMTPCGHNFCDECIRECLNRNHQCPACRADCTVDRIARNHHFDNLLRIVTTEKDAASRRYFETLMTPTSGGKRPAFEEPAGGDPNAGRKLTPIETVFQKHMRRSLGAYEDYYKELRKKYEESCVHTRQEYAHDMSKATAILQTQIRQAEMAGRNSDELKAQLERVVGDKRRECEERLDAMQGSFDHSVEMLLQSYDTWLGANVATPSFLPVTVSIRIVSRDILIEGVQIKPLDCLPVLQDAVRRKLEEMGKAVQTLPRECHFVLRRAFGGGGATMEGETVVPLDNEHVPLIQYELVPGSVIEMRGELKLKSDVCFSGLPFDKDAKVAQDYMSCKDCKTSWICQSCAANCHKGHTVVPYVKAHVPNYACCYCVKTKRCVLENSKTVRKESGSFLGPAPAP